MIEECVALVGVDLNTADEAVLRHVPGLHKATAKALVQERAKVGRFSEREDLKKVPGVGKRRYQDAVGFTRVYPAPGTSTSISRRAMCVSERCCPSTRVVVCSPFLFDQGLPKRESIPTHTGSPMLC